MEFELEEPLECCFCPGMPSVIRQIVFAFASTYKDKSDPQKKIRFIRDCQSLGTLNSLSDFASLD